MYCYHLQQQQQQQQIASHMIVNQSLVLCFTNRTHPNGIHTNQIRKFFFSTNKSDYEERTYNLEYIHEYSYSRYEDYHKHHYHFIITSYYVSSIVFLWWRTCTGSQKSEQHQQQFQKKKNDELEELECYGNSEQSLCLEQKRDHRKKQQQQSSLV